LDGEPEVPSCAWSWANNDVVRGQWGWDGFFVSDCGAIDGIVDGFVGVEEVLQAASGGFSS
jgi:beta-glucosidase-like glycosyl hydrolase